MIQTAAMIMRMIMTLKSVPVTTGSSPGWELGLPVVVGAGRGRAAGSEWFAVDGVHDGSESGVGGAFVALAFRRADEAPDEDEHAHEEDETGDREEQLDRAYHTGQ